jgi:hypothetical protein
MGKLENTKNVTTTKWCRVGDRCSKESFEFHKGSHKKVNIIVLVEGGQSLYMPEEIKEYVQWYYTDLYTNDDIVENNSMTRE